MEENKKVVPEEMIAWNIWIFGIVMVERVT
jgi:hypothetical protein